MESKWFQMRSSWVEMRGGNLDILGGNLDTTAYPNFPRLPQFRSSVLACHGVQIGRSNILKIGSELKRKGSNSCIDFERPSNEN